MIRLLLLCAGVVMVPIVLLLLALLPLAAIMDRSAQPDFEKINADTPRSQISKKQTILSEDGAFTAIVQDGADLWLLNGRSFSEVWVGKSNADHVGFALVFSGKNRVDAYWSVKDHLVIRLGIQPNQPPVPPVIPSKPDIMLRSIGGVHISYRPTDELSEDFYRERLQEYEQGQRDNLNGSGRRSTPDQAWKWVQELWGRYLEFRNWLPPPDDDPSSPSPPLNTDLDIDATLTSPGGGHVATLVTSHKAELPEGTASYAVKIAKQDDPKVEGELAFYALDGKPEVTWDTPTNLVITIGYLSRVTVSLHKIGGVTITYRLTKPMQPAGFRGRLERQSRYRQQAQPPLKLPPPEEQKELSARLDNDAQEQLERYAVFQQWANDNVESSER